MPATTHVFDIDNTARAALSKYGFKGSSKSIDKFYENVYFWLKNNQTNRFNLFATVLLQIDDIEDVLEEFIELFRVTYNDLESMENIAINFEKKRYSSPQIEERIKSKLKKILYFEVDIENDRLTIDEIVELESKKRIRKFDIEKIKAYVEKAKKKETNGKL